MKSERSTKEKVLAARSAGVKHVILPAKNKKDLEEIPQNVQEELSFHFVNDMDEVIALALTKEYARTKGWGSDGVVK